jgi:inner membrane protease subunit 2
MKRMRLARVSRLVAGSALAGTAGFLAMELLDRYVATTHVVSGPSMAPTLSPVFATTGARDTILLVRLRLLAAGAGADASASAGGLRRGDVVSFRKPHDPERSSVKRVLALPGDRVRRDPAARGRIEGANSYRLGLARMPAEIVVPPGYVWVEGDGWRDSLDSNDFGAIPINLITGRAIAIIWPLSRFGRIPPRGVEKRGTKVVRDNLSDDYDWEQQLDFR